jgi:hypothetical protein
MAVCWALVAHATSMIRGGRDRRQRSGRSQFEASLVKQFMRPYLENIPHKKRAGRAAGGVGPQFKPQYCKKKYIYVYGCLIKLNMNLLPDSLSLYLHLIFHIIMFFF